MSSISRGFSMDFHFPLETKTGDLQSPSFFFNCFCVLDTCAGRGGAGQSSSFSFLNCYILNLSPSLCGDENITAFSNDMDKIFHAIGSFVTFPFSRGTLVFYAKAHGHRNGEKKHSNFNLLCSFRQFLTFVCDLC